MFFECQRPPDYFKTRFGQIKTDGVKVGHLSADGADFRRKKSASISAIGG